MKIRLFLLEPTHHWMGESTPIRPGAKAAAVKKSFRQLALRFHPDKNLNSSELQKGGVKGEGWKVKQGVIKLLQMWGGGWTNKKNTNLWWFFKDLMQV